MTLRGAIAIAVRKLRSEKQLRQVDVALGAHMSKNHYCKIEQGKHMPSDTTIENICVSLGVCPSELFYVIADKLNIEEMESDSS